MKANMLIGLIALFLLQACNKGEAFEWSSDYDISVMSFNIRYDTDEDGENKWENRKEACVSVINKTKPSVFGIQEGLHNQVVFLKEELIKYDFVGVGRDDGHSSGEYAAIFYSSDKFELLDNDNFWLSQTPDEPSLGWDANNIRIVSWAHLRDIEMDTAFYIFNTHFDHKGNEAREESAKLLVNKIEEIAGKESIVFITGDFNALKGNSILDPIHDQFDNARTQAEYSDKIRSYNAWGRWYLNVNIDYIFYRNSNPLAFRTVEENYGVPYVSDHYPIIAHFDY